MLIDNTPWEEYVVVGSVSNGVVTAEQAWPIWVKREDLCCGGDDNAPSFSKVRGVVAHLQSLENSTLPGRTSYPPIGVLDTYHSKAGRGVAWICRHLGIPCYVFFPVYKRELTGYAGPDNPEYGTVQHATPMYEIREHQLMANRLGAYLVPLKAGRSSVLYHQAKKRLAELTDGAGYMLPNALKLHETVEATAQEVWRWTPLELWSGTWVVSISSGTIAAGVMKGLCETHDEYPQIIAHMGYSRSKEAARKYMVEMAGVDPEDHLTIVDEGYAYKDKVAVDVSDMPHPICDYKNGIPFPCNEYYDAKAFIWLIEHIHELEQPVVFWNIGD